MLTLAVGLKVPSLFYDIRLVTKTCALLAAMFLVAWINFYSHKTGLAPFFTNNGYVLFGNKVEIA